MTDVVVQSLTHPSRFILEHGDHRQVVLVRGNAVAICYVLHLYVIIIKNTYVIITMSVCYVLYLVPETIVLVDESV